MSGVRQFMMFVMIQTKNLNLNSLMKLLLRVVGENEMEVCA